MILTYKHTFFFIHILLYVCGLFAEKSNGRLLLGIECVTKKIVITHAKLPHPRIGVVTNQTGRTMQGDTTIHILQKKDIKIAKIFAPEHGYWGTVPAGHEVKTIVDPVTRIPVISLYAHGAGKVITAQQLKDVDVLIFDMQDSGMRHYTYISSLYKIMEACKTFSKPLIVCDRPNPLGGYMEGPLVESTLLSFISIAPVPLRHGMTIGELALYFNGQLMQGKVALQVVPMQRYTRKKEDFSLFAPLSPNLSTLNALYGYSFLGLLGEIKPFDVGVGTQFAFQRLGLPNNFKNASLFFARLENSFKRMQLPVKKIHYTNQKNKKYIGLQFLLNSTIEWSTMQILITILQEAKKIGISLTFSPTFDKAFGSSCLQKAMQGNKVDMHFMQSIHKQTQQFYEQAKPFFLYKPYPRLID
jgi:uncharacterized protein YbbC (DUF1343 family)